MKLFLSLCLLFLNIKTYAAKIPSIVFSVGHSTEFNEFTVKTTFTLMEDGKYLMETSSGGFHFCTNYPAGVFKGQLSGTKLKKLLADFKLLDKACSEIKSCSTEYDHKLKPFYDFKVLGWGKFSKKKYFFRQGNILPQFFEALFNIEKDFYQQPVTKLDMKIANQAKNNISLSINYVGEKTNPMSFALSSFVVMDKNGERRLKGPSKHLDQLKSGGSKRVVIDMKQHGLSAGDYIIYSDPQNSGLSPCVVVK